MANFKAVDQMMPGIRHEGCLEGSSYFHGFSRGLIEMPDCISGIIVNY
jgi:hypothetical protein